MDYSEVSSKLNYNTEKPFQQLTTKIIEEGLANDELEINRVGMTRLASWKHHAKGCEC